MVSNEPGSDGVRPVPHVVIVGGGFGGLAAARGLARAHIPVTIIDRHNYHLFRPLLYQTATGLLSIDEIAMPLRAIFRRYRNVDVIMADVTGVDLANRELLVGSGRVPYDILILATGIRYNYFGHADWQAIAPSLTSAWDAGRIRGRLLRAFEEAERLAALGASRETVQEWMTFILVGGGPTGVELAGSIAELARESLAGEFRHIKPADARIILLEAGPRILPLFPPRLGDAARRYLEKKGVLVRTGTPARDVDPTGVRLDGEHIASRTVLWAAGVRASSAGQWLGAPVDDAGRVEVNDDFTVPGHPEVHVIGDTARVVAPARSLLGTRVGPEMLPGMAQPAIQEGRYVASLIARRVRGRKPPCPFWYWDKGNLAIIGRTFAIADLKCLRFSGFFGWLLWLGVHIYYLIGFGNRALVLAQWGGVIALNRRSVRIFPPPDPPPPPKPAAPRVAPLESDHARGAPVPELTS